MDLLKQEVNLSHSLSLRLMLLWAFKTLVFYVLNFISIFYSQHFFTLNLQFQGTVNTVRLYGSPQPTRSSQPEGSTQPTGSSQPRESSQPVGSSSRPVTLARNIVPIVEKAIEVLEADKRKTKKPKWQKY